MPKPVIEIENIAKSYRVGLSRDRKTAVTDISLQIGPGEIYGILGPNGAGKTTLIKVMLGMVLPDGGSGSLFGKPLGDTEAHRLIGFLPEQPYFYDYLTAEKGLDLYGRFFGMSKEQRKIRSSELMDLVGLSRGSHLTLGKYSKGMLQRFGIAQALINDPELVIMDEPSGGLDPVGQKEIRDIILALKERGKTVFLSSHQLSEVENVCDGVSIINRGSVVTEGPLEELLRTEGVATITFRGGAGASLDGISAIARDVRREPGETVVEVEKEKLYEALDLARDSGLELVSLEPSRRSLEDLFLESIRETPG